jgi:uncharacterized repeat protein (TIGR03803 family)
MINPSRRVSGMKPIWRIACALTLASSSLVMADPPSVQIVHSFNGSDGRPGGGEAPLIGGPLGSVFGVTQLGGATNEGVLFFVDPLDRFHLVHSFSAGSRRGWQPNSLSFPEDGDLLGTTAFGGDHECGTVYRVNPTGHPHTIHSFDCVDGNQPSGRLETRDGFLYGTTGSGGSAGSGNAYRLSSRGDLTMLYEVAQRFSNEAGLYWGLRGAPGGALLGATMGWDVGDFHGVVFRIDTSGGTSLLHTFEGGADGSRPTSAPVVAPDGTIYGTTSAGGTHSAGTVYRITQQGDYSVLYSFAQDAAMPFSGLVLSQNGRLYGTTLGGGQSGNGTVFELTTNGQFSVIYSFSGVNNFGDPQGGLVETTSGTFYGTTGGGGDFGLGTIYKLQLR